MKDKEKPKEEFIKKIALLQKRIAGFENGYIAVTNLTE